MEKKFWLFAGDAYYPSGGFCDFIGAFGTLEEAKKVGLEHIDWAHIIEITPDGPKPIIHLNPRTKSWEPNSGVGSGF